MNNIFLIGRLTKDPEQRTTTTGKTVCSFNLAVDRRFKDQDGNKVADFFKCTAWNKTADNIVKYVHKGSQIAIQGELQTEQWEKDGVTHYGVNIIIDNCQFLDTKESAAEGGEAGVIPPNMKPVEDDAELPF